MRVWQQVVQLARSFDIQEEHEKQLKREERQKDPEHKKRVKKEIAEVHQSISEMRIGISIKNIPSQMSFCKLFNF